ncbi:hypothetical protein BV22DRAFT_1108590 [Leucogyrophana mollusca]|uniref:Uncharacterized protein n=1 Tax=Leucogyrophana mollusca TaxID=85980 RepID=A0ACB8AVR0_9AGAM|nr:hypothetical protein BV22DRAFT_1108590 [Leucogyrophana mollusca]
MSAEDCENMEAMISDGAMSFLDVPYTVPPGDEGVDISHEGGEHEIFKGLAQQIADLTGFRHVDHRTQNEYWGLQVDWLAAACLDYRARDSGDGMPTTSTYDDTSLEGTECPALAQTLIHHGYLGCVPLFPTVAISIRTLAAYRQAHRTCPRFSIQAQCKVLCHMHTFSAAYDIYLEIVYDKPKLDIAYLTTMDGNNSLKRWSSYIYGNTPRTDSRRQHSDYWLDRFKDEVPPRQGADGGPGWASRG